MSSGQSDSSVAKNSPNIQQPQQTLQPAPAVAGTGSKAAAASQDKTQGQVDNQQTSAAMKNTTFPKDGSGNKIEKTDKTSKDGSNSKDKKPGISVAKVEVSGDNDMGIEEAAIQEETVESKKMYNTTAVIVLAMGLGITAILLIFVGCRLRNVKRRLRRGRPMNSNEADYLINGMYL